VMLSLPGSTCSVSCAALPSFATDMSHHYRIYGLRIESSRALTLLPSQPGSVPDLIAHWTTDRSDSPDAALDWDRVLTAELMQKNGITLWRAAGAGGNFTRLRYDTESGHIDFLLDPSLRRLWIIHGDAEPSLDLESYFVGPGLGCVLRLRGTVCLHASVVKIRDQAIAILGKKKAGKSTSAAGLAQLGAEVLSDDMAVLERQGPAFLVHPGYPQIRLWPRSIAAVSSASEPLPKVYSHRDKRYLQLRAGGGPGGAFWPEPLRLAAIYLLGEINQGDTTPYVEAVAPRTRLMALVENTFGSYVVLDEMRRREFALLAELSEAVPLRRLMFGHDLSTLPAQSEAILKDLKTQVSACPAPGPG
jgi:hypothetical protein